MPVAKTLDRFQIGLSAVLQHVTRSQGQGKEGLDNLRQSLRNYLVRRTKLLRGFVQLAAGEEETRPSSANSTELRSSP